MPSGTLGVAPTSGGPARSACGSFDQTLWFGSGGGRSLGHAPDCETPRNRSARARHAWYSARQVCSCIDIAQEAPNDGRAGSHRSTSRAPPRASPAGPEGGRAVEAARSGNRPSGRSGRRTAHAPANPCGGEARARRLPDGRGSQGDRVRDRAPSRTRGPIRSRDHQHRRQRARPGGQEHAAPVDVWACRRADPHRQRPTCHRRAEQDLPLDGPSTSDPVTPHVCDVPRRDPPSVP
jgi:hypothetical protein